MKASKKQLGQFYTTNYSYILQNMTIPPDFSIIIEPFVGNGDLLKFLPQNHNFTLELYDIDPKIQGAIQRDTLLDPPCYDKKFVLTNPPYLARNKNKEKRIYESYDMNDLYKCFLVQLIQSSCEGGILIIPLNFICSIRKKDVELRKKFFSKFQVKTLNIFEESVFEDTRYSVCSLFFLLKKNHVEENITLYIYPSGKTISIQLKEENNFTIGGELYNLPIDKHLKIERATKLTSNKSFLTNILVKCIDDSKEKQLGFQLVEDKDRFIDQTEKLSARSYATLIINTQLSLEEQRDLVEKLNKFLQSQREKYNSLFLTNYRESNHSIARKRISFEFAFHLCNHILSFSES